ncbi:MAG: translation initiation factor IF-2, partial [Terriglobia bacterium]
MAKTEDLTVKEGTTVKELAELVDENASELIKKLIGLGEMVTINQPLGPEAISVLAEEFGYKARIVAPEEEEVDVEEGDVEARPPVVTIMGHVDHGKTLLLDAVRETDVVSGESGGITQHIGAYQIVHNGKKITFVDTPGHEAFTAMRARGAGVTDIAILVVAADDGVMPQTVEAIDHARAAGVPIIVAVNKIDKKGADPDKVKRQLADIDLAPEEWGGKTVFVSVSAKERTNLDELLEMILLVAELNDFTARYQGHARGIALEAKLDKGRGPVATVLVQQGKLNV